MHSPVGSLLIMSSLQTCSDGVGSTRGPPRARSGVGTRVSVQYWAPAGLGPWTSQSRTPGTPVTCHYYYTNHRDYHLPDNRTVLQATLGKSREPGYGGPSGGLHFLAPLILDSLDNDVPDVEARMTSGGCIPCDYLSSTLLTAMFPMWKLWMSCTTAFPSSIQA